MNYKEINRKSWNQRVDVHMDSEFYDMKGFLSGKSSLNSIELELLGDIRGKEILHLQCHFGQDTISLARKGAIATGVDLSDKAIKKAKELASQCGVKASFIQCDLYDLPNHLDRQFDIVFTSYGTIGWLPDLDKWAGIVSRYLKPKGKFVFVEFHPVVWMFDDDFKEIEFNYFNSGSIIENEEGTYADKKANISPQSIVWNHSLSEVVNSLIKCGLTINSLDEYDYSPYNCFKHTVEFSPKKFRIKHLENKIPMIFAIEATKH
jgi:ubiquinone/menaquinone biosynthesis C-methylase UbiE